MTTFPDDSIQQMIDGDWWEVDPAKTITRGALVMCHVPFFSKIPQQLVAKRMEARDHSRAEMEMKPLSAHGRGTPSETLPVAGLGTLEGADAFIVQRCKRRPCLVLGGANPSFAAKADASGMAKYQTAPYFLVSPFYGADQKGRSGYENLTEKIRHAYFRQFFWDQLPIQGSEESILRFDQTFPVGHQNASFQPTGFKLSDNALFVLDQWLDWYVKEMIPEGDLRDFKILIDEFYSS